MRRNLDTLRSDINNDAAMMDTVPLEAWRARLADQRTAVGAADLGSVYPDPYVPRPGLSAREVTSVPLAPAVIAGPDGVVIHTDHVAIDCEAVAAPARLVFETRNATRDTRCDRARIARL
jgi:UDP-N-acetyl-D-mannosaminuronate dehydrogenase